MTGQVAVDGVGRIGMGVEVDHPDISIAMDLGDRGGRGPGDGVVAAHRERDDVTAGDLVHPGPDVVETLLDHAVGAMGIAVVDDLDVIEDLQPVAEVVGARLVGVAAQAPRAEARTRSVGGAEIERSTDHGDVGLPGVELFRRGQQWSLGECHHRPECVPLVELLLVARRQVTLGFAHGMARYTAHIAGKAKHPGLRSQPKQARRPGRLLLVHDPPLVDLPALALARLNVIARQLTLAGDSLCRLTPRLHGSFPDH